MLKGISKNPMSKLKKINKTHLTQKKDTTESQDAKDFYEKFPQFKNLKMEVEPTNNDDDNDWLEEL